MPAARDASKFVISWRRRNVEPYAYLRRKSRIALPAIYTLMRIVSSYWQFLPDIAIMWLREKSEKMEASMAEQIPFGTNDFAENPEPRVPCVLVLDVSQSMRGDPIEQLNQGLMVYRDELSADPLASKRVEVAIVTFGPVRVQTDFTTAAQFTPPRLVEEGDTPMGEATLKAIEMVAERKKVYRTNGIGFYRPWIFLITDGGPNPNDPWQRAAEEVRKGEAAKAFTFYAVGVEGANFSVLEQLGAKMPPIKLKGLRFRDLFAWLSNSQQATAKSQPGQAIQLVNPTAGADAWATAET
jgi:uncharacterized protein YegL